MTRRSIQHRCSTSNSFLNSLRKLSALWLYRFLFVIDSVIAPFRTKRALDLPIRGATE